MRRHILATLLLFSATLWLGCESDSAAPQMETPGDIAPGPAPDVGPSAPDTAPPGPEVDDGQQDVPPPPSDIVAPPQDVGEQPVEDAALLPDIPLDPDVVEDGEDTATAPDISSEPDVTSAGACDNPHDLAVLAAEGDDAIDSAMSSCAMACLGQGPPCQENCVRENTDLSDACAVCFGEILDCTMKNCALRCISPSSAGCVSCMQEKCYAGFEACAGMAPL